MEELNRRRFIEHLVLGGGAMLLLRTASASAQDESQDHDAEDARIFTKVIEEAGANGYNRKPIGEVMGAVGLSFLGVPYVAHSLEQPGDERLIINLRAFDCTTFMESVLILSRCIRQGLTSFDDYKRELQLVRYRAGTIDGYQSRLHYFTDWVQDNTAKHIVQDITRQCGGQQDRRTFDFMTTHLSAYPKLSDPSVAARIRAVEEQLTSSERYMLPKSAVGAASDALATGDILGTVTTMPGIDVSHVGLALRSGGKVKFLHAPLSGGVVTLTATTLAEYLAKNEKQTGIIVARPVDPA